MIGIAVTRESKRPVALSTRFGNDAPDQAREGAN
jgi:hypothetical protein